jgi:hypothetical protein
MVIPTESSVDITVSFFVELIFTSILLLVIFLNFDPSSAYRKKLTIDSSGLFTLCPIITGVTLMILIYLSITLFKYTGIGAGHMFPLITIPGMTGNMGIANVSIIKGLVMLTGQFLAMFLIWYLIYKSRII